MIYQLNKSLHLYLLELYFFICQVSIILKFINPYYFIILYNLSIYKFKILIFCVNLNPW